MRLSRWRIFVAIVQIGPESGYLLILFVFLYSPRKQVYCCIFRLDDHQSTQGQISSYTLTVQGSWSGCGQGFACSFPCCDVFLPEFIN